MKKSVFIEVKMTLEDNSKNSKTYIFEWTIYLAPSLLAPGIDAFEYNLREELHNTIVKAYATKSDLTSVRIYLDDNCIVDSTCWPLQSCPSLSNFGEIEYTALSSINSFIDRVAAKIVYEIVHINPFLTQRIG